jgi:hypothetical protein
MVQSAVNVAGEWVACLVLGRLHLQISTYRRGNLTDIFEFFLPTSSHMLFKQLKVDQEHSFQILFHLLVFSDYNAISGYMI